MKPQDIEEQRYATGEFNSIRAEERLMFTLLAEYQQTLHRGPKECPLLDVGCGSGRITEVLARQGYPVQGLDFSENALAYARRKGLEVHQCNLDEGIPHPDQSFQVVWAGDIVEHVFDPIGLLSEISRVLKQGGALLISIPNDVGLVSRIKMLFGISHQETMYRKAGYYKHHTFFTPGLIRFMLDQAGLRVTVFRAILNLGKHQLQVRGLPAAFYNEMILRAEKQ